MRGGTDAFCLAAHSVAVIGQHQCITSLVAMNLHEVMLEPLLSAVQGRAGIAHACKICRPCKQHWGRCAESLKPYMSSPGQYQMSRRMMTGSRQQTSTQGGPPLPTGQRRPAPVGAKPTLWTGCCGSRMRLSARSCQATLMLQT